MIKNKIILYKTSLNVLYNICIFFKFSLLGKHTVVILGLLFVIIVVPMVGLVTNIAYLINPESICTAAGFSSAHIELIKNNTPVLYFISLITLTLIIGAIRQAMPSTRSKDYISILETKKVFTGIDRYIEKEKEIDKIWYKDYKKILRNMDYRSITLLQKRRVRQ